MESTLKQNEGTISSRPEAVLFTKYVQFFFWKTMSIKSFLDNNVHKELFGQFFQLFFA
jgi:hypothetical protein